MMRAFGERIIKAVFNRLKHMFLVLSFPLGMKLLRELSVAQEFIVNISKNNKLLCINVNLGLNHQLSENHFPL